MGRVLPILLGRPRDLLVEPVVAERLPAARPGFSGGDPRPHVPGTLELLRRQGAEALPWTPDCDLLLAPYPEPGEPTGWLLDHLRGLPAAYPVVLFERDVPLLPNTIVRAPDEDAEASPAAGLRAFRAAFRHAGRGAAEALVLLPARRLQWLLRGSFFAETSPGAAGSLQNRRFLVHALDHQRALMLLAGRAAPAWTTPRRVMALAPHFDDEVLLYGAALAAAAAAGAEVRLVWLTDGGAAGPATAARRREEGRAAAAELGVHDLHFLDAPETLLRRRGPWRARLRRLIAEFEPERLHLPWWGDAHVDHFEAHRLALAALPRRAGALEIAAGGFWTPLPNGTRLPHGELKEPALACHRSQLAEVDYLRAMRGLARWQAGGGTGPDLVERHLLLAAAEYRRLAALGGAGRRCYLRRP